METARLLEAWHVDLRQVRRRMYDAPPHITHLAPASDRAAQTWRYTATAPSATWFDPAGRLPAGRVADNLVDLSLRMLEAQT